MTFGVIYTQDQLTTMQNAIVDASNALASATSATVPASQAADIADVLSDLDTYYVTQEYEPGTTIKMRGYAILAADIVTGEGEAAIVQQELKDALGSEYTPLYNATLAFDLAYDDFTIIKADGDQVPTLAEVATEHQNIFAKLGIPVTAWGGTAFTALGADFTQGLATSAELSDIQPTYFANLSQADVNTALSNIFNAGIITTGKLQLIGKVWDSAKTYFKLEILRDQKFGVPDSLEQYPYPTFMILQNEDGTIQVAQLQAANSSDGVYSNYSNTGSLNYSVDITQSGTPDPTSISITNANGTVASFTVAEDVPEVLVDASGVIAPPQNAAPAILIGNSGSTIEGGTDENVLLALGDDSTVIGGGGSNYIFVDGADDTVRASNADLTSEGNSAHDNLVFNQSGGLIQLEDAANYSGEVSNFEPSDTIDLAGSGTATGATLDANNVLTVDASNGALTLNFDPTENFTSDSFITASDGNGGTDILLSSLVGVSGQGVAAVDPATGTSVQVASIPGLEGVDLVDETAENGYLYINGATSTGQYLYTVNVKTGAVESVSLKQEIDFVADNSTGALVGLIIGGAAGAANVVAIDPATGAETPIASIAGVTGAYLGTESAANGHLYFATEGGKNQALIYTVNIATGDVTSVPYTSSAVFTADAQTSQLVGIDGDDVISIDPTTGNKTIITTITGLDGVQFGAETIENGYLYFDGDNTNSSDSGLYSVNISSGSYSVSPFSGGLFTADTQSDSLTVAELAAYGSTIDAGSSGLSIVDTAANIEAGLATLTADASEIGSITVTDSNAPALTVSAATTLGAMWNKAEGGFAISDTEANLQSLSASEITTLAANGLTALISTDADVFYTSAQSAAIRAAGLTLSASADDFVFESFDDGSSLLQHFGADDELLRVRTTSADGSFTINHPNVGGDDDFTSDQGDYNSGAQLLARSFNLNSGGGTLRLFGSDLQIDGATGSIGPSSNPPEFSFTPHQDETYVFLTGANNDVINFASGFGDDIVRGFDVGNANDVLNLSSVFGSFAVAQGAMATAGASTIITDAAGDTLKIVGVTSSSLTAAQLGFTS